MYVSPDAWMGIPEINTSQCTGLDFSELWKMMSESSTPNLKTMTSLTFLIAWEVSNEHNVRVFHNKQAPSHVVFNKIKEERVAFTGFSGC
jgi:hypothetical protein